MTHHSTAGLERRIAAAAVKWQTLLRAWVSAPITWQRYRDGDLMGDATSQAHKRMTDLIKLLIDVRAANRAWARKHPSPKPTQNATKKPRSRR